MKPKHLIYALILIIIGQSIYHHFNKKKLQGIAYKGYEEEKKVLIDKYEVLELSKSSLLKQNDSLIKRLDENLNKVIIIEKKVYEKRNRILRTFSADSLKRLITNRYN